VTALSERAPEHDDEHQVTSLELFFDLVFVFVFALTQVTSMLVDDPTWGGVVRGMLVVSAVWWAWTLYAWLTSTLDVDEGACGARSRERRVPADRRLRGDPLPRAAESDPGIRARGLGERIAGAGVS